MNKILSYEEFCELVPNNVGINVEKFLRWANNSKIRLYEKSMESDHALARHSMMFLNFMFNNGNIIKSILSNSGYPDDGIFKTNNTNNPIGYDLFSIYSDFFCCYNEDSKYTTLTTFRLVYYACQNLEGYKIYDLMEMYSNDDIFCNNCMLNQVDYTDKIWNSAASLLDERATTLENEYIDNISQKLYKNLSIDAVAFLDTVSSFFPILTLECNMDVASAKTKAIFGAIYKSEYTKNLKEKLISMGLNFDEIFKNEINMFDNSTYKSFETVLQLYPKDIRIIKYYFKKYLKTDEDFKIYDLFENMFDRKLGNSILIEQLLLEHGMTKDEFLKKAKTSLYSESNLIEIKKKLYKDNSKQIIDYINYISSIYPSVLEIQKKKYFSYSDEEIVAITVFLNILKTDNKGSMNYFKNLGITLEDVLNYFQIKVEKQEPDTSLEIVYNVIEKTKKGKKEERITEIEGNLIDLGNLRNIFLSKEDREFMEKYDEICNIDPDFIELKFMSLYGNLYKEIMSKINPNISFKETLVASFRKYIEESLEEEKTKTYNENVKKAKVFYKNLDNETIFYISSAYAWRSLIKNKYKSKFNDDEITALSLFRALEVIKTNIYVNYFVKLMIDNNLIRDFSSKFKYPVLNDNDYINNIDDIKMYYEKFIFDGLNKDKESSNIKVIDVFKNMLNKDLYDTDVLLEFLKPYDFFDTTNLEEQVIESVKTKCFEKLNITKEEELINNTIYMISLNTYIYYLNFSSIDTKKIIDDIGLNDYIKFICIFYQNGYVREVFDKYGVTHDDYLKYLNVDIADFKNKMVNRQLNEEAYIHLYDLINKPNIFEELKLTNGNIKFLKEISKEKYDAIKYELENKKPYVRELTKEEKLEAFSLTKVEVIDTTDVKNMRSFGNNLSITSNEIVSEFTNFNMNNEEKDENGMNLINIVNSLNSKPENKRNFLDIFRKKEEKNTMLTKEILEKINDYLNSKEVTLDDRIKKLEYIKKAMRIYLIKAKEYLDSANNAFNEFKNGIKDKDYDKYDLSVFDDATKKQVLEDKVTMLTSSITMMLQQYEKVVMQLNTHDALLNQIKLFKMTTLQNLYVELSLHEGIKVESETIGAMNTILNLLNDLSLSSSESIISHMNEINTLEINNSRLSIDDYSLDMLNKITSDDEKRNVKK